MMGEGLPQGETKIYYGEDKINWPHTGLAEFVKRKVMGTLVEFGPKDVELQAKITRFKNSALNMIVNAEQTSISGAVVKAVKAGIQLDKKRVIEQVGHPLEIIKRHRLIDRFNGKGYPTCIDFALMAHLVFERIGVNDSKVVAFLSANKVPTFACVRGDRIYPYEKSEWIPIDKFKRARRLSRQSDLLISIYP